jgi:hypothetical protein
MTERQASMTAVQLNHNRHSYTSHSITITPNPPQVGIPATITLELSNTGTEPLTVQRIESRVAQFGMGVPWETLTPLGPFTIAPKQVKHVTIEWTPSVGGHRCLQALIYTDLSPSPVRIGRNMYIIDAKTTTQPLWEVPFAIGNPTDQPAPVLLRIEHDPHIQALLLVKNRVLYPGETIELVAKEEAQGNLLLWAETPDALNSAIAVEAFINGQFLDGIEVTVRKPAHKPGNEAEDTQSGMQSPLTEIANPLLTESACLC